MPSEQPTYKYFAFISYSRKDSKAAAWLQKRLEWFRFPVKLVPEDRRPPHERYIQPIFRDKTNLPVTDEHYWTNIRRALEESRFLIVLCSPNSAHPRPGAIEHPVDMEVAYFLEKHAGDASLVAPIIVSGNVASDGADAALCPALRALRDPRGDPLIKRNLPAMVPDTEIQERDAWEAGFAELVSYLLKVDRTAIGDHIQREMNRQKKSLRNWVIAVSLLAAASIAVGLYAIIQKQLAEKLLWDASYSDHESALLGFEKGQDADGVAHLERALRYMPRNNCTLHASALKAFGLGSPLWRTRSFLPFEHDIIGVTFAPDGRLMAVGHGRQTIDKAEVTIVDAVAGKIVSQIRLPSEPLCFKFSPDGIHLAIGSLDKRLRLFDVVVGKELFAASFEGPVTSTCFSPDGIMLAAGSSDNSSRLFERFTGKEISRIQHNESVTSLRFSEDSRYIVSALGDGDADRSADVHDAETGAKIRNIRLNYQITSVVLSGDGRYVVAGDDFGISKIIDSRTGEDTGIPSFEGLTHTVVFSPDYSCLAVGTRDGVLKIMDRRSGKEISKTNLNGEITTAAFSSEGRYVVAGSRNKMTCVIVAATGEIVGRSVFDSPVKLAMFSPDSRCLVTASEDDIIRVSEPNGGHQIRLAMGYGGFCCISQSGNVIGEWTGDWSGTLLLNGASMTQPVKKSELGSLIALSADGRKIALSDLESEKKEVLLIDAVSGAIVQRYEFPAQIIDLSLSPNGKFLAIATKGRFATVIDLFTGENSLKLEMVGPVTSVAFSPDGNHFAASSVDGTARIFRVPTQTEIARIVFEGMKASSVAFTDDGQYFGAAGVNDEKRNQVRIIDISNGKEVCRAETHVSGGQLCFGPGGKRFLLTDLSRDPEKSHYCKVFETATGKFVGLVEGDTDASLSTRNAKNDVLILGGKLIDGNWLRLDDGESVPAWAAALRLQASQHFLPAGQLTAMSRSQILIDQEIVSRFIAAPPPETAGWQHAILKWAEISSFHRTTSPWSSDPLRVAVGSWLMKASLGSSVTITAAADAAPWHPLEPVSLARIEHFRGMARLEDSEVPRLSAEIQKDLLIRIRYLARLTLKRLRNADQKIYGRDTLDEYARWSAKIMREELKLDAEAKEALDLALKLTPVEEEKKLLERSPEGPAPVENPPTPSNSSTPDNVPSGRPGSTPNRVISPYPPFQELDVESLPADSLVLDPVSQKIFRLPPKSKW